MNITLRNNFHGTRATIRISEDFSWGDETVRFYLMDDPKGQRAWKRAEKRLYGKMGCKCESGGGGSGGGK